jgi:hypothetical protein
MLMGDHGRVKADSDAKQEEMRAPRAKEGGAEADLVSQRTSLPDRQ